MDSNVFGGVIKRIEDGLSVEQMKKFNIMRKPRVKTALETKTKQFNFIPSKVKSLITRPNS